MASFTMELRTVLKQTSDIGLGSYPVFEESYRAVLNQKIIDHFYLREIGAETPEMFRLFMRRKMNEIMPEYNQFYLSERLVIDPLKTLDISALTSQDSTTENTTTGDSTSDTVSDSKARAVDSSTPQNMLADYGDYADGASDSIGNTKNTGTATENSSGTIAGNTTANSATTGYSGSQADLLQKYRSTFLNIDLEIINRIDAGGLFMNLWSSGDSFTERNTHHGAYPRRISF